MLYQCPGRDLAITDGGSGLHVRVPKAPSSTDPWNAEHVPVSYRLEPTPGFQGAQRLLRKNGRTGEERPLRGCLLKRVQFALVPLRTSGTGGGGLSDLQAYLEITLVGMGSENGTVVHTASMLYPLVLMAPVGLYTLRT
jgi:hypothetical protein